MQYHRIMMALVAAHLLAACGGSGSSVTVQDTASAPTVNEESTDSTTDSTDSTTDSTDSTTDSTDSTTDSTDSTTDETNTASATVIKSGTITGFGSVYINGTRYLTDQATVTVNEQQGAGIDELKVGMRISMAVDADDTSDTPVAKSIRYSSDVEGVVQQINRNTQHIVVAGSTINYNDLTHFIGLTEQTLSVGQRIEISAYVDANGSLVATYIELDNDSVNNNNEYTLGLVSGLDTVNQTFLLDTLQVNYANAVIQGTIADGQAVKVEGVLTGTELTATEVEAEQYRLYRDVDDSVTSLEIEGVVSDYNAANGVIVVNGVSYSLAANAQVVGTPSIGTFVELYVDTQSSEVVRVELENERFSIDGKVKGVITAVNTELQQVVINGRSYQVTPFTRFEDDDDQFFHFSALTLNQRVELIFRDNAGVLEIQRIELEDDREFEDEWELKGTVETIATDDSAITISGVTVLLNDAIRYFDDDRLITRSQFIQVIKTTALLVEVEGYLAVDGSFVAQSIEIENNRFGFGDSDDGINGDSDDGINGDSDDGINDDSDDGINDDSDDGINDDSDDGINDDSYQNNGIGYVEIEGRVTALLTDESFRLNSTEVRLSAQTELELFDRRVSVSEFMSNLSVGTIVEVEGTLIDGIYIDALEAEIEND